MQDLINNNANATENQLKSNRLLRIEYAESIRNKDILIIIENTWYDHNISAIFRTVEAAGLKNIIVAGNVQKKKIRHDHIDFKCSKFLDIQYFEQTDAAIMFAKNQGYKIFATFISKTAQNFWACDFSGKVAIIFGAERDGVSDTAANLADYHIWIPTFGLTRSLNVSVSAGIIIYDILKRKFLEYKEIQQPLEAPFMKYPGERG